MIECSAEPSVLAGQNGKIDYLFDTNLDAKNCLESVRKNAAKIIFLSTSRVYDLAKLSTLNYKRMKPGSGITKC